ncbi:MAG: 3-keto-5-aminohexanoate cleavage protein [Candidatus Competibacteraceae bacterium]|nr:3-keto-5-aminohexanoate cleavage protein [Candidatus Competibacteraceae bacterium]
MPQDKVIISCAITGSVHTPSMSPYLPVTPDEIAQQAIQAARAGAAVLHLHARDPKDGRPTPDPGVFMEFLPQIKAHCDAVINITTGGGNTMTVDQRMAAALVARPELCSLNMGSMNFGIFPLAERERDWQHNWERPYLEATRDFVFKNTFADIERLLALLGEGGGRFEFECYDVGHLYNLAHFLERGLVKPPLFVQFVLGILGGMGADPENLLMLKTTADRLLGPDRYRFSVAAAGRQQLRLNTVCAVLGGNVRVGLEDSLSLARGRPARSNAEQVTRIRQVLEALSFEIASPLDARRLLDLKGADRVAF